MEKKKKKKRKEEKNATQRVERYRNYIVMIRLMDALILERKRLTADEKQADGIEQWVKNFASGHFFLLFAN